MSTLTSDRPRLGWDGKDLPYDPHGRDLEISDRVAFHTEVSADIDPVGFEVIQTKLWNINEEHADTIRKVSGSPTVVYNSDFNTCVVDEVGEPVLFGPYIQYFTAASEFIIKYTLENRGESPGINPGDVFLHNDSFIAGSHQMDVSVYAPVFVDGRIFAWVFSSCHVRDIGGVEPGSFCVQAPDIYSDPPSMRAMKIADSDGIRADVEDTFLRMSRVPHLLALEVRSQVAGAIKARARVEELAKRYSAATVKGVMRKIVDDAEVTLADRLSRLPDGRWTDVVYLGGGVPGDRGVYKQVLTLEKKGSKLRFSNAGTDPEIGSINCSYGQFCAATASALAIMLAYDHKLSVGAVNRLTEWDAKVGTISCVSREGAMSGTHAQLCTLYMAVKLASKMVYPDPELRRSMIAVSSTATAGWLAHSGTDQNGDRFATATLDSSAGGLGAMSFRDGVDQGGAYFWPKSEVGDCEAWEQHYPVVYLYRRSAQNGGHGKYRGGSGLALAWVGHGSEDQIFSCATSAPSMPVQAGLSGGHWGQTVLVWTASDTRIREVFDQGHIPGDREAVRDIDAGGRLVRAKEVGLPLRDHDVVDMSFFGGGGYGDPLERDLAAIQADLEESVIDQRVARDIYGAIVGDHGTVDRDASVANRDRVRLERVGLAKLATPPLGDHVPEDAEELCDFAEHLSIARLGDGSPVIYCSACRNSICSADANYKDHAGVLEGSLVNIDPLLFTDPAEDVDVPISYRTYICATCGVAFDNELTRSDASPVHDSWIHVEALS